MKRILLVHSRVRHEVRSSEHRHYEQHAEGLATLGCISTLDAMRNWNDPKSIIQEFDAIIFGGSGDFDFDGGRDENDPARETTQKIFSRVQPLIEYCLENRFPLLGICYGHQLVAQVCAGNVCRDTTQGKIGTYEVTLTDDGLSDPLFGLLPPTFLAQYGHKDSVTDMPKGATLLATGASCRFSAIRYGSHAYTTQFHPELDRSDMSERIASTPGYLPEGSDINNLFRESPEASHIIRNFIERIIY